jgi:hypothetical protein
LGSLIVLCVPRKTERLPSFATLPEKPIHGSLCGLAAASLLIWLVILPFTQPEQQRRWQAERLMYSGQHAAALQLIAHYEKEDFPPHWDPPPRTGEYSGIQRPLFNAQARRAPLIDVMEELDRQPNLPAWVRDAYARKFEDHFEASYVAAFFWDRLSPTDFDRYLAWLERHPPSEELRESQRYGVSDGNDIRTREQKQRFNQIMKVDSPDQVPVVATSPTQDDPLQTPPAAESKNGESEAAQPASTAEDR